MRKNLVWPAAAILGLLVSCAGISSTPGASGSANVPDETGVLVIIESLDSSKCEISFDRLEWISATDTERIHELGLDPEADFPNDYYIYNETEEVETLPLSKDAKLSVLDPENPASTKEISAEALSKNLGSHPGLYRITVESGAVTKVEAQYVP